MRPPPRVAGAATRIYEADVATVNGDGTVDLKSTQSRAMTAAVPVLPGYAPVIGDRVLVTDLDGDVQKPIVLAASKYAERTPDAPPPAWPIVRTLDPPPPNDGSTANQTWTALAGFSLTYTTPPGRHQLRALIDVATRLDHAVAAWTYAILGLRIDPAPVSRLHANPVIGGGLDAPQRQILDYAYGHSAGRAGAVFHGRESAVLAPGTAYTFTPLMIAQVAGYWVWPVGLTTNFLAAELMPDG